MGWFNNVKNDEEKLCGGLQELLEGLCNKNIAIVYSSPGMWVCDRVGRSAPLVHSEEELISPLVLLVY
jgi:hypothetical protein